MNQKLAKSYRLSPQVLHALEFKQPLVALESAVITHGLPYPENLQIVQDMEQTIRDIGAIPATIALLQGEICIGLTQDQLAWLAQAENLHKISRRDFAPAIYHKRSGGTTVAGTMLAAHAVGIQVFATGGIGGVHRHTPFDVSPDLPELARTPMIVVCTGAKAILDLPATLEYLETSGVPVLGYQTDDFPAFFTRKSGLRVSTRVETPQDVIRLAQIHWGLGLQSGILVTVPLPVVDMAFPEEKIEAVIGQAILEAEEKEVSGQPLTPFLLKRVAELTSGESLKANLALLKNNAHVAAMIAKALPRLGLKWV